MQCGITLQMIVIVLCIRLHQRVLLWMYKTTVTTFRSSWKKFFSCFGYIKVRYLKQEVKVSQLVMVHEMHVSFASEVYLSGHTYQNV